MTSLPGHPQSCLPPPTAASITPAKYRVPANHRILDTHNYITLINPHTRQIPLTAGFKTPANVTGFDPRQLRTPATRRHHNNRRAPRLPPSTRISARDAIFRHWTSWQLLFCPKKCFMHVRLYIVYKSLLWKMAISRCVGPMEKIPLNNVTENVMKGAHKKFQPNCLKNDRVT